METCPAAAGGDDGDDDSACAAKLGDDLIFGPVAADADANEDEGVDVDDDTNDDDDDDDGGGAAADDVEDFICGAQPPLTPPLTETDRIALELLLLLLLLPLLVLLLLLLLALRPAAAPFAAAVAPASSPAPSAMLIRASDSSSCCSCSELILSSPSACNASARSTFPDSSAMVPARQRRHSRQSSSEKQMRWNTRSGVVMSIILPWTSSRADSLTSVTVFKSMLFSGSWSVSFDL